jgi:beta-glucosidase-like glycosyl hydrolase
VARNHSRHSGSKRKTRLKIPVIYGIDSIHGANYIQGATLFPQEIGMAATWNPALMQRAAEVAAAETRAAASLGRFLQCSISAAHRLATIL